MKKRDFIKYTGLVAGIVLSGNSLAMANDTIKNGKPGKRNRASLKLRFVPYSLQLKHVFTIATNSRTTTPVVLTEIEYDGFLINIGGDNYQTFWQEISIDGDVPTSFLNANDLLLILFS